MPPYNTLGSLGEDQGPGNAPVSALGDNFADRFGAWQQLRPDNAGVGWSPDRGPLGWNMTAPPPFAPPQSMPPSPAYGAPTMGGAAAPGTLPVPLPQPRPAGAPQTQMADAEDPSPANNFLKRFFANFELPPAQRPRAQTPFAFGAQRQGFAPVGGANRGVGQLLQQRPPTGTGYG
jgi:hypothetical protein